MNIRCYVTKIALESCFLNYSNGDLKPSSNSKNLTIELDQIAPKNSEEKSHVIYIVIAVCINRKNAFH